MSITPPPAPVFDYNTLVLPDDIPLSEFKQRTKMYGHIRHLNNKHGVGLWGIEEVCAYIRERKINHSRKPKAAPQKSKALAYSPSFKATNRTRDERFKDYLKHFKEPTPNDQRSLWTLIDLEMQLESVEERQKDARDSKDIGVYAEVLTKLSREYRLLQSDLGIGRVQRESEVEPVHVIQDFVVGAKKFLKDQTLAIKCEKCHHERRLNLGFVFFPFHREVAYQFQFKCPNPACGRINTITNELPL